MPNKDKTFSNFVEFKALVEKETDNKVKALMINNGGEYVSNAIKDLCVKEDFQRELKAPHNPQQNGVAERKNQRILGVARPMLHDQCLPLNLWTNTCNAPVCL